MHTTAHLTFEEDPVVQDVLLYKIIDTPSEVEFDELVELAANICGCPIALIGMLDGDRFWYKAKIGTKLSECSREDSFCAHAIRSDKLMIVEDASVDERFRENIFVKGKMHIRFYAGAPIISPMGNRLGTLCVLNDRPGSLSETQQKSLRLLANQVMRLMELRMNNKEIMQSAEEHIRKKNKVVLKTVSMQEKRNAFIATTLHENLAQALAANRLYLQMAEESEQMRLPLIRKANDNLGKLVQEICDLSNSIVPSSLQRIPLKELVDDLVQQAKNDSKFNIRFSTDGDLDELSFELRIVLFKAVEKWLKMLAHRETVKNVEVQISVFDTTMLTIEDDGDHHDIEEIENDEATIKMETRLSILGGSGELTHVKPRGNMLTVII